MKQKPHLILRVKLRGEIYDRVYGIHDIEHVIDLFNEIHEQGMKVEIEEVKEVKHKETMLKAGELKKVKKNT